jgi:hypothetical protein
MREFDPQLWKERAWARYCRAINSGRPDNEVGLEWAQDVLAIGALTSLVEWCKEKKLKVFFAKKQNGAYHSARREVHISSRLSLKNQVVVLLHECGHHLIGVNESHDRFGMGYPQSDPEVTKTFHHRVACLEEEMEAWYRGWRLANRLGISVDRESFDAMRLKCIRSYIKWTLKPSSFQDISNEEQPNS